MNSAKLILLIFFGALVSCQEQHTPSSFQEVDESLFKEKAESGVTVLLIYSESCHYCPKYVPTLEKVAKDYPQVTFLKTNIPESRFWNKAKTPGGTPSLSFYINSKYEHYLTGVFPEKEVKTEIDWLLNKSNKSSRR